MSHTAEHHNPAAYNYAEALLNLVRKTGRVAELDAQSKLLLEVLRHDQAKMCRFLEGPQIATQDKLDLVDRIFAPHFDALFVNLMKMLVRRDRVNLLQDVLEIFSDLAAREQGLRTGEVTTAVALSDAERQRLKTSLEGFLNQRLSLNFYVEPQVLGGVVFQSGDELIDYSVRGRLEMLKKRLEGARLG